MQNLIVALLLTLSGSAHGIQKVQSIDVFVDGKRVLESIDLIPMPVFRESPPQGHIHINYCSRKQQLSFMKNKSHICLGFVVGHYKQKYIIIRGERALYMRATSDKTLLNNNREDTFYTGYFVAPSSEGVAWVTERQLKIRILE